MARKRQRSRTTLDVLWEFAKEPAKKRHGYDLSKETGIQSGSLYPILQRLLDDGLIEGHWEQDVDPSQEGRPRRRYYLITGVGEQVAREESRAVHTRMGRLAELYT